MQAVSIIPCQRPPPDARALEKAPQKSGVDGVRVVGLVGDVAISVSSASG
jgi:hypothetical protein